MVLFTELEVCFDISLGLVWRGDLSQIFYKNMIGIQKNISVGTSLKMLIHIPHLHNVFHLHLIE